MTRDSEERQDVVAHAPKRPELDWRINVTSLVAALAIAVSIGLWVGNVAKQVDENRGRIEAIEKNGAALQREVADLRTEIAVVRTLVAGQGDILRRIESNLEAIMRASRPAGGGD